MALTLPTFTAGAKSHSRGVSLEASARCSEVPPQCSPTMPSIYGLSELHVNSSFRIFDIKLCAGADRARNLALYLQMCTERKDLLVTTSCFSEWKENNFINGHAKVIPAVRNGGVETPSCIFFFDDNLEFEGNADSPGICNLRDQETAEFVEFGEGRNGFTRTCFNRHTVVHSSSEYRNVLVKANILDALENEDYFTNIISAYTQPHEKVLVFMDVNSTIVCNDTSAGKDVPRTLLSVMFELIEMRPHRSTEFCWDDETYKIEKVTSLKRLVKVLTKGDHGSYSNFWTLENCARLLALLLPLGEVGWASQAGPITSPAIFKLQFQTYMAAVSTVLSKSGIATSWFRCFDALQSRGHAVVLNSFGIDTRKVVLATVPDERRVMHITVDYELWHKCDVVKYESQFAGQLPLSFAPVSPSMFTWLFGGASCVARAFPCA
mmetsp:Transcript_120663/g.341194  ORF Transcript_120663/g.341194 Transcript_120663/m.341194 type:complete len:436 (+) Transcript_120663:69-1376(+)